MLARSPATSSARRRLPISAAGVDGHRAVELRRDDLLVVRVLAVDQPHRDRHVAGGHLQLIALRAERGHRDRLHRRRDCAPLRRARARARCTSRCRYSLVECRRELRQPVAVGRDHRQRVALDLEQRAHQHRAARLLARRGKDRRVDAVAELLACDREVRPARGGRQRRILLGRAARGSRSCCART